MNHKKDKEKCEGIIKQKFSQVFKLDAKNNCHAKDEQIMTWVIILGLANKKILVRRIFYICSHEQDHQFANWMIKEQFGTRKNGHKILNNKFLVDLGN